MPAPRALASPHPDRVAQPALGLALLLLGVTHLVFGADVQRMFILAEPMPGRDAIARALATVLVFGGGFILGGGRRGVYTRVGALCVALALLGTTVVMHLPAAIASGTFGGRWIGTLKWLALAGGVALLAELGPRVSQLARLAMAALMIGSAVAHLKYTAIVITLMPTWMPWREFFAYFTAATLAAGGLGLLVRPVAPLAGQLSAAMFAGFFVLVHIPRTIAMPGAPTGWAELGESLAYAGISLLLARTSRLTLSGDGAGWKSHPT